MAHRADHLPPSARPGALQHYTDTLRGFLRRRIAYWTIVDISDLDPKRISASDRAAFAEALDKATHEYPGILQCVAVVCDSPILRLLYTAHLWIRRNKPYPIEVFATQDDATAYVKQLRAKS